MTELEVLQYKYDQAIRRMEQQAIRHVEEQRYLTTRLRSMESEWLECKEFKRVLVEFIGDALDKRQSDREE